MQLAKRFN